MMFWRGGGMFHAHSLSAKIGDKKMCVDRFVESYLFDNHMFHAEDLFVEQIQIYQSTNSNWSFCHVSPYQFF
jgi:hypothetical protein